jgi:hypothetical protein
VFGRDERRRKSCTDVRHPQGTNSSPPNTSLPRSTSGELTEQRVVPARLDPRTAKPGRGMTKTSPKPASAPRSAGGKQGGCAAMEGCGETTSEVAGEQH